MIECLCCPQNGTVKDHFSVAWPPRFWQYSSGFWNDANANRVRRESSYSPSHWIQKWKTFFFFNLAPFDFTAWVGWILAEFWPALSVSFFHVSQHIGRVLIGLNSTSLYMLFLLARPCRLIVRNLCMLCIGFYLCDNFIEWPTKIPKYFQEICNLKKNTIFTEDSTGKAVNRMHILQKKQQHEVSFPSKSRKLLSLFPEKT